jgi:hypothetical protein
MGADPARNRREARLILVHVRFAFAHQTRTKPISWPHFLSRQVIPLGFQMLQPASPSSAAN